jgi:cytochrome c oxidase assembly protein subunit 15
MTMWMGVAVLQAAIGYIQYFNDVPAVLVAIHIAGATGLWLTTVWFALATSRADGAPAFEDVPAVGRQSSKALA